MSLLPSSRPPPLRFLPASASFVPPSPLPILPTSSPCPEVSTPHRLCARCRELCASLLARPSPPFAAVHYPSGAGGEALSGSASDCHLCTIVLARLTYPATQGWEPHWTGEDRRPLVAVVRRSEREGEVGWERTAEEQCLELDYVFGNEGGGVDGVGRRKGMCHRPIELRRAFRAEPPEGNKGQWEGWLGGEGCLGLSREWVEECRGRHEGCGTVWKGGPPRRLIDLRAFGPRSREMRVTELRCGPAPEYAALSWKWGERDAPSLRLTRQTMGALHTRLEFEHLPRKFADAVTVARKLGFTHLWIDALCVVQDDEEARLRDLERLPDVCGGCALTIAAAGLEGAEERFLTMRKPLAHHDCWLAMEGNVDLVVRPDLAVHVNDEDRRCPLNIRSWAMQERFFSPRTLYFSRRYIYWECREGSKHEQQPFGDRNKAVHTSNDDADRKWYEDMRDMTYRLKRVYYYLEKFSNDRQNSKWEATVRGCWMSVVPSFAASLSRSKNDQKLALVGAAMPFRKGIQSEMSFGLWHRFFLTDLLWHAIRLDDTLNVVRDNIPSWSWMSLNRPQSNFYVDDLLYRAMNLDPRLSSTLKAQITKLPLATDFGLSSITINDATSLVVKIKGPLLEVERDGMDGCHITTLEKRRLETDKDHSHTAKNFYPDFELPHNVHLSCLLISETRTESIQRTLNPFLMDLVQIGLALVSVDRIARRYRRVGIFLVEGDSTCGGCKLFQADAPVVEIELI